VKFTTDNVIKFALAALLSVCLLGFAREAPAADAPVSSEVVKLETVKGSDGIWRLRISLEVINRSNDDMVIVSVYDVSCNITAYLTDIRYGHLETPFTCKPLWKNPNPRRIELEPADSVIFTDLLVPFTQFVRPNWTWVGEETAEAPPLKNYGPRS
jgi:hypothetical protein